MRPIGTQGRRMVARQPIVQGNQVQRSFGYPEVRSFPFTTGYGAAQMHQEHGPHQGVQGYPEVRQWPSSGPNPSLPGVLIRVRQESKPGPGHRDTAV
jgi:hypothetical protein